MIYSAVTEQALLCCMLMDVETARNAAGMLLEDDFYLSQNRDVFRAIAALVEKNMVPDLPMISAELILAKNRNGPTGTVDLVWRKECTSFRSFSKWNETKEKGPWE